jgi:hypothetical protein
MRCLWCRCRAWCLHEAACSSQCCAATCQKLAPGAAVRNTMQCTTPCSAQHHAVHNTMQCATPCRHAQHPLATALAGQIPLPAAHLAAPPPLPQVHEPHSRDGGLLLAGDNPDLGPWELHWAPVALRSKKRVVLHHLGAKLQTDAQLTELPMMVNMAIQVGAGGGMRGWDGGGGGMGGTAAAAVPG